MLAIVIISDHYSFLLIVIILLTYGISQN